MAEGHEPGAALTQKFELLEKRIIELEKLLKISNASESSHLSNGLKAIDLNSDIVVKPAESKDQDLQKGTSKIATESIVIPAAGKELNSEDSRVRYVVRLWDPEEKEYLDIDQGARKEGKPKEGPSKAFTYRKIFKNDGQTLESSEIEIEDHRLNDLLKKVISKVYGKYYYLSWPNTFSFFDPYSQLVHCHAELVRECEPHDGDDENTRSLKHDLRLLIDTVQNSSDMAPYFKALSESPDTITFRYLWTVFPPGTEIVARLFYNQWQIFKVDWEPEYFTRELWEDKPRNWTLKAWCYDHNGQDYVKVFHSFKIDTYEGSKEISQLPFYPLKYHKGGIDGQSSTGLSLFIDEAIKNGNKFKKFCQLQGAARMFQYDETALIASKSQANKLFKDSDIRTRYRRERSIDDLPLLRAITDVRRMRITGRSIVDPEAFLERVNGWLLLGESIPWRTFDPDERLRHGSAPDKPEGDWARLCPPRILGYALDQKSMVQFRLADVREIIEKRSSRPYQQDLQLKKSQKDMLLALVDQHESGENSTNSVEDIVSEKGRSLVILLHGPPGVGKTLTAETVAKATGKPLFVVSVAEVGLQADRAESKLERLFDLAAKWEAILLVDEADVFLESRSWDADPERNALVAVLLRVLEYYTGTIILTTNRISSLDIAVQSRIHLAIKYNDLSEDDCTKIFKLFTKKLSFKDNQRKHVLEWFEEDVAGEGLNGRQIRNLVSSAHAISKSRQEEGLDLDCFKSVFKVTQEFQKQLTEQAAKYRASNEIDYSRKR